ncbi:DeoR family transcriptional regulator [Candidatus Peregrinibacteria bacterium]|nr:DeoR family transcriptional regulator [Candidatus Peregrinibacteria bacterium]
MDKRKQEIFCAIVKHFIKTANPVGSQTILISYNFSVSPATIRNDMVYLEREGLIAQPHTSAGRIPTDLGYRLYVNELADYENMRIKVKKDLSHLRQNYVMERIKEKIHETIKMLADLTQNVSFATLPNQSRTFYLGFSNILKQPEFREDSVKASQVLEVFEKDDNFLNVLHNLEIGEKVQIFIGKENIIEQIQSCSLIVVRYSIDNQKGFLGILGPTRIHYSYCQAALEEVKKMLEKNYS